nr:hypothetical protein [Treponema sp.]
GKWGGIMTYDSKKISLVGKESGWIHVTLHVEEAIWGRFTKNGKTYDNCLYIGIFSPIPVFCWDNSVTCEQPLIPYEINWDFSAYEDDTVYDLLNGGYLEDCYDSRQQINDYPSFYITFRDVTPESFAYSVNEASVMNVTSGINKKAVFKKLLSEIQSIVGTASPHQLHIRNAGNSPVSFDDSFSKRMYFARLFSEKKNVSELLSRKHILRRLFDDVFEALAIKKSGLLLFREGNDLFITDDSNERTLVWKRQLDVISDIESELTRSQEVFRAFENSVDVSALPFASRIFYRTVKTVLSFWDWLRGKIREANNVAAFYCPIWDEIKWECKI